MAPILGFGIIYIATGTKITCCDLEQGSRGKLGSGIQGSHELKGRMNIACKHALQELHYYKRKLPWSVFDEQY